MGRLGRREEPCTLRTCFRRGSAKESSTGQTATICSEMFFQRPWSELLSASQRHCSLSAFLLIPVTPDSFFAVGLDEICSCWTNWSWASDGVSKIAMSIRKYDGKYDGKSNLVDIFVCCQGSASIGWHFLCIAANAVTSKNPRENWPTSSHTV